jgi:gamma-glutamyltranspeptidase/glutathione hydrolase
LLRTLLVAVGVLFAGNVSAAEPAPGRAAIASAHTLATAAGFEALDMGGNAFDAAVAVAATLSVVEPQSSGIGGGGLFLLRRASDGKEVMLDARETAPAAIDPKDYLDANGQPDRDHALNGPLSAAIPGEPAALVALAKQYGKLPLAKSLAPAIRLARHGFQPDPRAIRAIARQRDTLTRWPASAALYLDKGAAPKQGWTLRLPDLANVLEAISRDGNDGFYRGEVARRLVEGVRAAGGRWSADDLAKYEVKERKPIAFEYRDWHIVTAPPPSSGGIALAEMLNILGGYDLGKLDRVHRTHLIVESMRRAYRDRAEYLGDPDFVQMPVAELTHPLYAAGLRASIHPDKATPSDMLPGYMAPPQSMHTSHFSIIDRDGNLVRHTDGQHDARLEVRRRRHRLRAQQRDGRLRARRRQAERIRSGRQRQQRAQAGQPPAVVDDADLHRGQGPHRRDRHARRQLHHHDGARRHPRVRRRREAREGRRAAPLPPPVPARRDRGGKRRVHA